MIKISEVLHLAADEYLSVDNYNIWGGCAACRTIYSCDAWDDALHHLLDNSAIHNQLYDVIATGQKELGLDTDLMSEFNDIPAGEERQGARYAWLKFCALLAEEQGV